MKLAASFLAVIGSAAAFAPATTRGSSSSAINAFTSLDDMPGSLPPIAPFDPLGLAKDLTPAELKCRREAELHHGRKLLFVLLSERVCFFFSFFFFCRFMSFLPNEIFISFFFW